MLNKKIKLDLEEREEAMRLSVDVAEDPDTAAYELVGLRRQVRERHKALVEAQTWIYRLPKEERRLTGLTLLMQEIKKLLNEIEP